MRVLYLVDSYRPARSACANRTSVLVGELLKAGHDVQVLASTDSLIGAPEDYISPDYVSFFETFPLEEKTFVNRLRNNFGGSHESVKVAETMGEFDLVVCSTPPLILTASAMKIARRKHAKLAIDVRDIWPDVAYEMGTFSSRSPFGLFFDRIASRAYRQASLVVSVSPGKIDKLEQRAPGKVRLIPNGVDEAFLRNELDEEVVNSFKLDEGTICAYVGNIGLAQGLETLLDIASKRTEVRFLLFGEGASKAALEERACKEHLANVEFCGSIDAQGVYTVLHYAAVSYVPLVNSRLQDSIPTKLYEALACGCPVLLAASGDAAKLLDESGLGLHAIPEDSAALLEAFDQILRKPFSAEERISAAEWVVKNHSRQAFAQCFAKLLEQTFQRYSPDRSLDG